MRAFIVLSLLAATLAAPQGYNYQHQNALPVSLPKLAAASSAPLSGALSSHSSLFSSSASHASSSGSSSSSSGQGGQSFLNQALSSNKFQQNLQNSYGAPVSQNLQNSYGAPAQQNYYQGQQSFSVQPQFQQRPQPLPNLLPQQHYQQPQQQQQQPQQQYQPQAPVVTKDIYVHVAPEEPGDRYAPPPPPPVAPPRKHYRIVFIKAPTPPSVNQAALRLQQAPTEEKTIIYVLTKKPDPLDLQAALQDIAPKQPSKPEVYFIKYKTQEEAQHAQRTIQAQYDQLGGTTQVSDEGIAPVTSVIGSLDHQHQAAGGSAHSGVNYSLNSVNSNANKYLPPIVRI